MSKCTYHFLNHNPYLWLTGPRKCFYNLTLLSKRTHNLIFSEIPFIFFVDFPSKEQRGAIWSVRGSFARCNCLNSHFAHFTHQPTHQKFCEGMPFFFFEIKSEIGLEGVESPELRLDFTNQPI